MRERGRGWLFGEDDGDKRKKKKITWKGKWKRKRKLIEK